MKNKRFNSPSVKFEKTLVLTGYFGALVMVAIIVYLCYKEPRIAIDSSTFRLKGIYGVNIQLAEIAKADTITWSEMPKISIRTNGISLRKVHRGRFRTADGDKVRLNIHRGTEPVIRLVDNNGLVYYINRKNPTETRQIFEQLKIID